METGRANTCGFGYEVEGGNKLKGAIDVSTSKNGAVVLLCASLLNRGITVLHRVPDIEEVHRLIEVLESIGVRVAKEGSTLTITPPKRLSLKDINEEAARRTRSIIMFIGPLLASSREFSIPLSGGCKLGTRTVRPHLYALERLGASIETKDRFWHVSRSILRPAEIIMYESGDTATENALMTAASIPGKTVIKYASANYMVQELCHFLSALGVSIEGVGTTTLVVQGKKTLAKHVTYTLSEDPVDAMFWIATAATTRSGITIRRAPIAFLERELLVLEKMGLRFTLSRPYAALNKHTQLVDITMRPSNLIAPPDKVHATPYPGLNMDNLPFFAVIATQARGTTLIHDWVYEKRALYLTELDKLGAETLLADPHRIFIEGPTTLRAADMMCPPALRPATVLLIAMLAAEGTSTLRNVYSINRGYEGLVEKLTALGAKIQPLG